MLYFAYGSNMDVDRMTARCGSAKPLGPATIPDARLVQRRFADIDFVAGDTVHGVLWTIEMHDLPALDAYEGFPTLYTRLIVAVDLHAGKHSTTVPAMVYEMTPAAKIAREGIPYTPEYWGICHAGAVRNNVTESPFFRSWKRNAHSA